MAITKIHAIKTGVSKSIAYIMNLEKTQGKLLVSGFRCVPETADIDFFMTEQMVRNNASKNIANIGGVDIKGYHMIQSFTKGEKIDYEEAHRLGQAWADEFLQGSQEYVIATHVDKGHIHNHIIFNAYSQDTTKKFRTQPYKTADKLRTISDRLCAERGLHVLENPTGTGQKYKEWQERKTGNSWKAKIENRIITVLPMVSNFLEFKESMKGAGVEVNDTGKYVKYRLEGQENWSRANGKSLSLAYSREGIIDQIHASNVSGLHHITITERLVIDERDGEFYTRIPYTQQYVNFPAEDSTWFKNRKTLSTFIDPDDTYLIYDRSGNIVSEIDGEALAKKYDVKERKQPDQQHNVVRLKGTLETSRGIVLPLTRKLAYVAKKQRLSNVQDMAQVFKMLRQENITSYRDLYTRIGEAEQTIQDIKAGRYELAAMERDQIIGVVRQLETCLKYEGQAREIAAAPEQKREQLTTKYHEELRAYAHAKNMLEGQGVAVRQSTLDAYKIKAAGKAELVASIQKEISLLEKRKDNLIVSRETILKIYGQEPKTQQGNKPKKSRDREL